MNTYKNQKSAQRWLVFFVAHLVFVVSAVSLVYSKHVTRSLYAELQTLQNERDNLDNEWTKLLLEQSAWAADGRVDAIARQDLALTTPSKEQIIMVRQ